jgi:outer membrane protein assembly factor BamB
MNNTIFPVNISGLDLRLCRLMCGMASPYRRRSLIILGLCPDRWGTAPAEKRPMPEGHRPSAQQAAEPQRAVPKFLPQQIISLWICLLACAVTAFAQRGGNDWMTDNADAQRTATIKVDSKINKDSVAKPGAVQFLWKLKLKNTPHQLNNLSAPSTLERLIGYRGFRMLGFVGGSGDNIITIDTDLGRLEYEKKLPTSSAASTGTLACPGGMTTSVVRPTTSVIAAGGGGGFGPGRNTPAKSTVGEPWAGATTLANVRPPQGPPPGPPPGAQQGPPRPNQPPTGGGFGSGANLIYALASDGMLHSMHLSNGQEYQPPVKFLPPGANANGLIIVNGKAYAVTAQSCNGVANGLWAYDFEAKQTSTWKGDVVGSAGAAFGGDGTIYVTTTNGVTALDPKTLQAKSSYSGQEFSSTPVVFEFKGKTLIVAATKTGSMHLLDAANLSSALATMPATGKEFAPGALASWQDASGTRWILIPTNNAVIAWKVVEQSGGVSLQFGWASRELVSPLTPTIINGVVFATSSGEFRTADNKVTAAQRAARSKPAVIYALDGTTGKELWHSGTTIKSFARGNALSGGMGQFYLTTFDGTLYAFGFPIEH